MLTPKSWSQNPLERFQAMLAAMVAGRKRPSLLHASSGYAVRAARNRKVRNRRRNHIARWSRRGRYVTR